MALAPTLAWLFVGRVISGITAASVSTSFAYIADVTPPEQRAAKFGIVGAAFGFGFVLGPALGGLLGEVNPRLPFWGAAALSLANATYGLFVLPESLARENRSAFTWRRANPVGALKLLRSHPELSRLAVVNFLAQVAHVVLPSVSVLYMDYRYGWGALAIGLVLAGVGVCSMIVQGVLVGRVVRQFGERTTLLFGLLMGAAGFAIYGLAPRGWLFAVGVPVMALWGLSGPTMQALMTRRVDASEQGQLQGANSSIAGIASLVGPTLFTLTFAYFIGAGRDWHVPGAPFLLAAALMLVAAILSRSAASQTG
jgi:DHA1 family tetracycline resistance protein-like MFS transporter